VWPLLAYLALLRATSVAAKEESSMQKVKSLGFRIVMVLSALASSALVLEAGQRWR
jgi:hypothetical protein